MPYSHKSCYYSAPPSPSLCERCCNDVTTMSMSRTPRSRSRSHESTTGNPGNDLYVTGLSARITKRDLMELFSNEGKVVDVHLVTDLWSRECRRFGFVTMSSSDEAESCINNLDSSVFEGRIITVEKARRRAPTPPEWHLESSEIHRCRHYSATRRSSLPCTRGSSFSSYYKRETSHSAYCSGRSSCSHSSTLHHWSPVRRYYCDVSPDYRCHRCRYCRWMSCDDSRLPRARSDTGSCSPPRRNLRATTLRGQEQAHPGWSPRYSLGQRSRSNTTYSPGLRSKLRICSPRSDRICSRTRYSLVS